MDKSAREALIDYLDWLLPHGSRENKEHLVYLILKAVDEQFVEDMNDVGR